MQVPDLAVRCLRDRLGVALDPCQVSQARLVRYRPINDLARAVSFRAIVQQEFDRARGLVAQQPVGVLARPDFLAIDRQQVIALAGVDADLGQWRPIFGLFVLSLQNPPDAVEPGVGVQFQIRSHERDLRAFRQLVVAARYVGVADIEFGDHLADDVVQVRAMSDMCKPRTIAVADRGPVVSVHVLRVKEIPIAPPHLVENRFPFVRGNEVQLHLRRRQSLGILGFGLRVEELERPALTHE